MAIKEEPVPEKIMQNETFRRLLDSVKLINFVEELFNAEVKNMTDLKAEHEIGFSESKAEGLSEGERNKAREMALKMIAKNKPFEEIIEFSGLTEAEINTLKTKLAPQGN